MTSFTQWVFGVADAESRCPDRIELQDAEPTESVLLLNYVHQPAATPYRASHAIFVREWAAKARVLIDAVPAALRTRPLSLRAFDVEGMLVQAELAEGSDVESSIRQILVEPNVADIHAHFARHGCYAARIGRFDG